MATEHTLNFTLKDHDGEEHSYIMLAHQSDEGIELITELLSLAGEPIGRLIDSNLGEMIRLYRSGSLGLSEDAHDGEILVALMENMDSLHLSEVMGDLTKTMKLVNAPDLVKKLLKHTSRDGKPLGNDIHFNAAFRQNYGEMVAVARKAIEHNRFLGFLASFTDK